MKSREQEYREIFMAEALEYYDAMSRHISELEKDPTDEQALNELFRVMHNLKANGRAMGYADIGEVAHGMETIFGLIRSKERTFSGSLVPVMFSGIDTLGRMIRAVGDGEETADASVLLANLERLVQGEEPILEDDEQSATDEDATRKLELSDLVYIQIKKLDHLLNLVGELIIDRDRILTLSQEIGNPALQSTAAHLFRITDDLQYSVMDARLVNVGSLFNKFPRVVRDVAVAERKDVELVIVGQDIQIDRNILQIITDALLHLVRNAIGHGLETPDVRRQAGKPAQGHLTLSAQTERDDVLIQVTDDGRGIDVESVRKKAVERGLVTAEAARNLDAGAVRAFLFEPGFSMAKEVTDISGRGVGLDVVKLAIDSLGGQLRVESVLGQGTTFSLVLPTSIAVKGALLFELASRSYAIPLMHTDSVVSLWPDEMHVVGGVLMARILNENIPVINLHDLLHSAEDGLLAAASKSDLMGRQDIIIVNYNNRKLGLIVDRFLRQQDIVIKPMSKPLDQIDLFGGVTLLGSGQVCLVLDVPALTRLFLAKRP
ncbi:two-component system, chemotaxis family, sensor kinase CheA [Hymenobacter daecheongensis DSM 21074]|uniref:Chemotaxis protein CheA n=1 Tax=Hymenobacter daecheongensis DSM 21074 TaxID=1121955 RepID=A0A1M6ECC6_9BACT|nr:chemotaxis protein CheA [Hymenobacter daecheongensis]SHI83125.1 two-component system, chemotaxis family, sensor kinase CheA [Hymenobacter daecheongensis DSM 21074]